MNTGAHSIEFLTPHAAQIGILQNGRNQLRAMIRRHEVVGANTVPQQHTQLVGFLRVVMQQGEKPRAITVNTERF